MLEQIPPSSPQYSLHILTNISLLSHSWKEWLLARTPVYTITQIIREAYLLSNTMRRDIHLHIYFKNEIDLTSHLKLTFNPQKLRYLAPDSRSIYFLLHNSVKRYYMRQEHSGTKRTRKALPGIHVESHTLPQSIHTDLLITPLQDEPFSHVHVPPAPLLGSSITITPELSIHTPIITPKYHVQWNPMWQFLTLYLNHPKAEPHETQK